MLTKNSIRAVFASTIACFASPLFADAPAGPASAVYHIQQTVTLSAIPAGAKSVKWWIAIPEDDANQEVLDITASIPGKWTVIREPSHGNRIMFTEVSDPTTPTLAATVDCTVRRRSVSVAVDPAKVGLLTDTSRRMFSDDLRQDAPHMQVTAAITEMANKACGAETNSAIEAKLLLGTVADGTIHYSRDATKPKYSPGDAESCLAHGGGTCTDIHSLFIALARSRGIPARLQMGYRLKEANEGKSVDPGYRCWAEYFLPGYGWIPTDLVEAEDPKGLGRDRWFTGLTERRVWLNQGREFDLPDRSSREHRVNMMSIGYAEIDGVEARVLPDGDKPAQLSRTVLYTEIRPPSPAFLAKD